MAHGDEFRMNLAYLQKTPPVKSLPKMAAQETHHSSCVFLEVLAPSRGREQVNRHTGTLNAPGADEHEPQYRPQHEKGGP